MQVLPRVDVLIVGGGLGGCAAAIAAASSGARVRLTEESPWIGGQATNQATPPDEHPWIEDRGSTDLYRRFRALVRTQYAESLGLPREKGNPGRAWATTLGHPPVLAHAVLTRMLLPGVLRGTLEIHSRARPISVAATGDRIDAVTLRIDDEEFIAEADWVLDATETGELLPLAGVEHSVGSESQSETGEPHAGPRARPDNLQAVTVPLVVSLAAHPSEPVARPASYARWAREIPPHWPGPLLSWSAPDARTGSPRSFGLQFGRDSGTGVESSADAVIDLWTYRRLIAPGTAHLEEATSVNWPMNDYVGGHLLGLDADEHVRAARELSLSLLHWLQTEAPRPDGGTGYPRIRPRGDLTGTPDGLAMRPYIREGRRIRAELTILEQDVALAERGDRPATEYADSLGTGAYRIDLHPSTGGDPFIDIATRPFEIPLRALLPVRVDNLLPAAKNIGTTHITNGCYRVHPAEWTIGEAAGRLAAFCIERSISPRRVSGSERHLADLQAVLERNGFDLHWRELNGEAL